jgi:hypothetical protein
MFDFKVAVTRNLRLAPLSRQAQGHHTRGLVASRLVGQFRLEPKIATRCTVCNEKEKIKRKILDTAGVVTDDPLPKKRNGYFVSEKAT